MKFTGLLLCLAAAIEVTLGAGTAAATCLSSGNEQAINNALRGPDARVYLCPRAVFEISSTIELSAPGQELATQGEPEEDSRAIIRVVGKNLSTAIESRSSNITLHHLIIDGQRARLGRLENGGALIDLGGDVTGVRVDHVRAFDPRGWSTLHIIEGGKSCSDAQVTYNVIGPAGTPNHAWADGISFACRNGLVAHNTVIDASDGAIVIFGAPGTLVEDNTIMTRKNVLLGGINLVDYGPYAGNYTGVVVRNNRIEANGGFIKVAIAVGPAAWGDGYEHVNRGGAITNNRIVGNAFGYGIAVDGARDFTITGNRVTGRLSGGSDGACDAGHAPSGKAFIRDPSHSAGTYQSEFELGNARWSICVQPP
jgi:hypothetical protein